MKPVKITMSENYSMKDYNSDVKRFDKEGSFLGSEKDNKGRIVFIIDKDKSNILKENEL